MSRKISAIAFMLVMTLLITLKHPVLGYCLCLDAYFTGDCTCQTVQQTTTIQDPVAPCCASCAAETQADPTSQDEAGEKAPCDECTHYFNLDVGDFLWDGSDQVPAGLETLALNTPAYPPSIVLAYSPRFSTAAPIRGDPPPETLIDSVPLYLRHLVLRL